MQSPRTNTASSTDSVAEITLRQIDEALGHSKGTAFRAFKQLLPELVEGRDFRLLDAEKDRRLIDTLRAEQRIYRSSRNVVLLTSSIADRIVTRLR
jgi:hypothetical protein